NSGATVSVGPDTASATVQTAPALTGTLRLSRTQASVGQDVQLILDVTNSGEATAANFTPDLPAANGPGTQIVAPPAPADVLGGTTVPFTWTVATQASGSVSFSAGGSATDGNNPSAAVPLAAVSSTSLVMQTPALLSATLAIPQTLPLNDTFTVSMSVLNSG